MPYRSPLIPFVFLLALAVIAHPAPAQVSYDEAQRRLQEKLAARPAATQPATEVERLREENRRLRERLSSLQEEVTTLKESLARAATAGGPATRPAPKEAAVDPKSPKALLPGRWHGGDAGAGAGYVTVFDPDGTYKQTWLSYPKQDLGQYQFVDDNTLEMWGRTAPEDRRHNQYRITINGNQITLTPLVIDGADVKNGRAVVLKRAD
ncbi:MAG TPA: hypothetical protein VG269_29215 [Tepidisphaeraceae bacterium]|jgi:hypothetical protein|nr:hypothetical protein [Tepidisphaeraceae bacterium]